MNTTFLLISNKLLSKEKSEKKKLKSSIYFYLFKLTQKKISTIIIILKGVLIMKTIKRYKAFETNSSSTHSVQLLEKDVNEKWLEEGEIQGFGEIRTPYNKMIMLFGLLDHVVDEYRLATGFFLEDKSEEDFRFLDDPTEDIFEFEMIIIDKYLELFGGDRDKIMKEYKENERNRGYSVHCLKFFDNDCLMECNCEMDGLSRIYKDLKIEKPNREEFVRAAEYLFNPNVYFKVVEYYCGLIEETSFKII